MGIIGNKGRCVLWGANLSDLPLRGQEGSGEAEKSEAGNAVNCPALQNGLLHKSPSCQLPRAATLGAVLVSAEGLPLELFMRSIVPMSLPPAAAPC